MTLLDSMLPINMPKIGMKYRALNTFSTLSTIPIKYKPTHTTLHKKVYPPVIPLVEIFHVYDDEEQLDNHACRTYHSSAQQSGLELPDVKQRY